MNEIYKEVNKFFIIMILGFTSIITLKILKNPFIFDLISIIGLLVFLSMFRKIFQNKPEEQNPDWDIIIPKRILDLCFKWVIALPSMMTCLYLIYYLTMEAIHSYHQGGFFIIK